MTRMKTLARGLVRWTGLLVSLWTVGLVQGADLTVETVSGSGKGELGLFAGPALEVNINQPFGVEFGPDKALYITEVGHHRVLRQDMATGQIKTVAGNGKKGYSGDGGPATEAELNEPYEVRFDADGNMFFVEMVGAVIRRVDAKTGVISTIAGTGKAGYGGDGGPATQAQFKQPHSIVLDGRGGLFVADLGNHRLRRIDLKSGVVDTVCGTGGNGIPTSGAEAKGQQLRSPRALFCRGDKLWVVLREGHSIWELDLPSGKIYHLAGTGKVGMQDGPGAEATFNGPKGVVAGPGPELFIMDTENQAVRRLDLETKVVSTVAGFGPKGKGFAGDGGPALKAKFDRPHGITCDADGALYLGDTNNHRVRRVK